MNYNNPTFNSFEKCSKMLFFSLFTVSLTTKGQNKQMSTKGKSGNQQLKLCFSQKLPA